MTSSPPPVERGAGPASAAAAEGPIATRVVERCLACGGKVVPLAVRYEYRGQAFPLAECRSCGMRFLTLQPVGAGLAALYAADYFDRDFRCGRSSSGYFVEDAFRDENRGLLEEFENLARPGHLLEVGCAGGWLLQQAAERGWRAQGVELSAVAATHARSLGLDVFQGELIEARLPAGEMDLIYMGDVLEHVPDCRATIAEVVRLLRRRGYLYLRGPTTTNSLARSLALRLYRASGQVIVLREPPYHLWEFTPRSLAALLRSVGLEVVRIRQSKIPPGRPHGEKTGFQRGAMAVLDTLNVPLTRLLNVKGDRVVVIARKP